MGWPRGCTFAILAGGPSLSPEQVEHVRRAQAQGQCKAIAVNDSWRLAPWADVLYACDKRWWDAKRPKDPSEFAGVMVSQDAAACATYGLEHVPSLPGPGLCRDPWVLHQGLNSGYQAINLAYHLGAARIILLGYDMQRTGGKSHWFGDHPPGLNVPSPFRDFIQRFGPLAKDLELEGVQVFNCSTETALNCFPKTSLCEVLPL